MTPQDTQDSDRTAPTFAEDDLRAQLRELEGDMEQLVDYLVETQDQLLAMYDLSKIISGKLGLVETLRHLAAEASRLVHSQGVTLCVGPIIVQHPLDLMDERALQHYLRLAQERGGDLLLNDGQDELTVGIANLCLLSINVRSSVVANLCLVNRKGGFTAPNLKLARAIAEQAGTHIERALHYQESLEQARLQAEMAVARQVQLQLLPQAWPQVDGLEIYAESRPALQVGGDFYDFVAHPDRPLMLLLGDVAGKGISAAMMMGLIRIASRSAARFMPDATPASVLDRTNHDLYDDMTLLDSFITTFAAQYLPEERLMRYANAGHAPVIYRPPGGPARMLDAEGVPIGVLPVSLCEDAEVEFGPGSLLVVATDGLNEARDPAGTLYGYERLIRLVDELADRPAHEIAGGLYSAVEQFSVGQPREDDQTLIVVKGI